MKILLITHVYPISTEDYKGVFVHEIACGLARRGHEVMVLAPLRVGAKRREIRDGVSIRRFWYWGWWRNRMLGELQGYPPLLLSSLMAVGTLACIGYVLRFRIDVLHAYWIVPGGLIAAVAGRLTGRPAVATAAGSDLNVAARRAVIRPFVTFTLKSLRHVMAAGSGLKELALEMGVDTSRCSVIMPPSSASDATFVVNPNEFCRRYALLYVGNLAAPKRVDTLLRAVQEVAREIPEVSLTIVGDGVLRADLERLAAELEISERVRFCGMQPHALIPKYLSETNILLHCSEQEGLPVAITEAMRAGKAVVAARVGGIPDIIADGNTGFLADTGDFHAFAQSISKLLNDDALCQRMGENAREFAKVHLNSDAIIEQIVAIYEKVLQEAKSV